LLFWRGHGAECAPSLGYVPGGAGEGPPRIQSIVRLEKGVRTLTGGGILRHLIVENADESVLERREVGNESAIRVRPALRAINHAVQITLDLIPELERRQRLRAVLTGR